VTAIGCAGCLVAVAACLLAPAGARAQTAEGRMDVAFGARWVGAATLGSAEARLTTADGGTRVLFETHSELTPVRTIEAAVHIRVARFLRIGGSVSSGRSRMETRITADFEGAPDTVVSERVTEFAIGGVVAADLRPMAGARFRPFIAAGAGHLRHVHEGRPLVEIGRLYHVGGGADYVLRGRGGPALGVRVDLRAVLRSQGLFADGGLHASPAVAGSLFVRF